MQSSPYNRINFAPPSLDITPLANGGMILRSKQLLAPYGRCVGEMLEHWAATQPERVFLAERDNTGGWRKMSFGEVLQAVRSIAQALLERGLGPEKPLAILSENSIDHALLGLAAMHVGIPYSPISTAYSLMSADLGKLKYILDLLSPGLVYASSSARYERALTEARNRGIEVVASLGDGATSFASLLEGASGPAVGKAFSEVGPDTIAKILFTSGSTGQPKGVINTQRMMCANQQSIAQYWPFLSERPPVIVDWLPWNHTFGGNHNFNMMLRHGGTIYIDEGRPMPGLVEKTVANLKEVSPTLYFNVPRGFDMLLSHFERDEDLRNNFFRELDLTFYAGASLPQNIWDRLTEFSIQSRKKKLRFVSSWGATETSPMITMVNFEIERSGVIGLPAPGNEMKLVPNAGKLEMRARGPNITPGYYKQPELTAKAFDEDGFYITGDAGRFDDPSDPIKGIQFDGRIAEDFKLMSGTWVHVGSLRVDAIAALAPIAQDVVITGHDREELGVLIFPSQAGCLSLCPDEPKETPLSVLIRRHEVREKLKNLLVAYGVKATGNSTRIMRALLMDEPPSIDAGEITDKGYINQRAVLTRRADLVELLYEDNDPEVLRVKKLG